MKKNLLLLLTSFGFLFASQAQITILSTDAIDANSIVCLATDTVPDAAITPGDPGTDLTWDFSGLMVHEQDTLAFIDPIFTPHDDAFADDNMAFYMGDEDAWSYLKKTSSYIETVGAVGDLFGTGTAMEIEFNPRETIIQFPFTYMDSYVDTSGFEIIVDTVKAVMNTITTVESDAWGTMITPVGTYDAIRVSKVKIETMEISLLIGGFWIPVNTNTDTSYTFEWWSNSLDAKYPVASMDWLPENDSIDGGVEFLENTYVNREEIKESNSINVYPNPSDGKAFIQNPGQGTIEVYNATGQKVWTIHANRENMIQIDLSNQPNGIYYIKSEAWNKALKLIVQ